MQLRELPATAQGAQALGSRLFFTGRECRHGHVSPRYASSGNCVACIESKRGKVLNRAKTRVSEEEQRRMDDAMSLGFKMYKSARACPSGHDERFVGTGNCVACNLANMRARRGKAKWTRIKKIYGLTEEQFHEMFAQQSGLCAICSADLTEAIAHIDHCHGTGKVRGLLCGPCNQGVGLLKESPDVLLLAVDYLRRHGK